MRAGAVTTSRALAEQATASEQIAKSADGLNRMIGHVSKAMSEQSTAATQISAAVQSMRRESDQSARALKEQSRAVHEMASAAQNTTKQIKLITHANRQHSTASSRVLDQLGAIRQITDRTARGVKETRGGTADLLRHAEALTATLAAAPVDRTARQGPTVADGQSERTAWFRRTARGLQASRRHPDNRRGAGCHELGCRAAAMTGIAAERAHGRPLVDVVAGDAGVVHGDDVRVHALRECLRRRCTGISFPARRRCPLPNSIACSSAWRSARCAIRNEAPGSSS